eukprot:578192-Pyramimonas_sp.AAC.1
MSFKDFSLLWSSRPRNPSSSPPRMPARNARTNDLPAFRGIPRERHAATNLSMAGGRRSPGDASATSSNNTFTLDKWSKPSMRTAATSSEGARLSLRNSAPAGTAA